MGLRTKRVIVHAQGHRRCLDWLVPREGAPVNVRTILSRCSLRGRVPSWIAYLGLELQTPLALPVFPPGSSDTRFCDPPAVRVVEAATC